MVACVQFTIKHNTKTSVSKQLHVFCQCAHSRACYGPIITVALTIWLKKRPVKEGARGDAVVEALRYKPEGRGIDSRRCHWNFSFI
jgi:hypothetical protein